MTSLLALLLAADPAIGPDRAAVWEPEIVAIEAKLKRAPANPVVFAGSSSIRFWDTAAAFPGRATVNVGFGGSELRDTTHFLPRLIGPIHPTALVLYAGDNDLAAGRTPDQVRADFVSLVAALRKLQPAVPVYFVAIKPSPLRAGQFARQTEANRLVRAVCAADPMLHGIDIVPPMRTAAGQPNPELFRPDRLHLNPAGYAIWTKIIAQAVPELVPAPGKIKATGGP